MIGNKDYESASLIASEYIEKDTSALRSLIYSALKKQREEMASVAESFYIGKPETADVDGACLLIAKAIREDI